MSQTLTAAAAVAEVDTSADAGGAPEVDAHPQLRVFVPPKASRGLFVVLPGRGDVGSHYVRLGERLAFDGYTVAVAERPVTGAWAVEQIWNHARAGRDAQEVSVLIGVDVAAGLASAAVAADDVAPTALVLAGATAGTGARAGSDGAAHAAAGRADEIAQRTSCPVHRQVLADSSAPRLSEESTDTAWPAGIGPVEIPVLVLHGAADRLAPVGEVLERTSSWGNRTVVTVVDGVHDVLNDIHHRTIAAELVSFAERLRVDRTGAPVVTRIERVAR